MAVDGDAADALQVLYVEDHPVNVLLVEALFARRSGCKLHVATTGMDAWNLSAILQPDLLLVDLRLPDCHGSQLLERLRQRPGWAQTRAIAVTAEYDFKIEGTSFSELWPKPLNLPWVVSRLDALLQPRRQNAKADQGVQPAEGRPFFRRRLFPAF